MHCYAIFNARRKMPFISRRNTDHATGHHVDRYLTELLEAPPIQGVVGKQTVVAAALHTDKLIHLTQNASHPSNTHA